MDFIKKVITAVAHSGLAPGFPYVLDEQLASEAESAVTGGVWAIHAGHHTSSKRDDPAGKVTLFIADLTKNPGGAAAAKNALRWLKTLRHPRILKLLCAVEADGKIYIASEPVRPLMHEQAEISASHDLLMWGTLCLVEALRFTNEEAQVVHGNVRRGAVFVTKAGEFKLAGFELAAAVKEDRSLITEATRHLKGTSGQAWPPEVQSSPWQVLRGSPVYSIDTWLLASLLTELFESMPPVLAGYCREALNRDPLRRRSPSALLEPSISRQIFEIPAIRIDRLISQLAVASPPELEEIFRQMSADSAALPERIVSHRLLPAIIAMLEIQTLSLEGIKVALKLAKRTEKDVFKFLVQPFLLSIVSRPDRAIRLVFLDELEGLLEKLEPRVVQDTVFGHFVTGFTDPMPELRERTLKASVLHVPHLSSRQINSDLVRHYGRLQADEQPGIRVNACICLGKISAHLDPATKQKVFVNVITRALQDPFPPSRSAALLALMATMDTFSDEVMARNLLPLVCTLLVDKDTGVCEQAFSATRKIVDRLEESARTAAVAEEPSKLPAASSRRESVGKKAAEWGQWGLSSITEQVSKIQSKYSHKTSPRAAPGEAMPVVGFVEEAANPERPVPASRPLKLGVKGPVLLEEVQEPAPELLEPAAPSFVNDWDEEGFVLSEAESYDQPHASAPWADLDDPWSK